MRGSALLVLVAGLCIGQPAVGLDLRLPDFGDASAQYLSQREEQQLGAGVLRRLRERGAVIEDAQVSEYLNSVGQRIATSAGSGQPYTFFWVNADSINAFATPGSYIGVHSGLFQATRSESELAGVLAHEVAHVAQRHIARAYADSQRMLLPMMAAMAASAALAASVGGEAGQAALASTLAASAQRRINFTRGHEEEADRIGYQLLERAGFDPDGMATFFAYLARQAPESANALPDYLRTHPRPVSRMADAQSRGSGSSAARGRVSSEDYFMAKARVRVLSTANTSALINHYRDTLATGDHRHEAAERYGYVLALKRAGRLQEASAELGRLLQADPDRLALRIEQAELALASGADERAWTLFEQTARLYPDDYRLAMHYGQALAAQGDPRLAMQVLEPQLKRRSRDLGLLELYARATQRAGEPVATHAAMAEYYYLSGDLQGAIDQAELGLRSGGSPYERARLQSRLRELQALKP